MRYAFMLFPDFKSKAFTMSYDDGVRQDIRLIEIMQRYGLKGTFNLNSGIMEAECKVHADEITDVYLKSGNEVAVHGVQHLSLATLTEERMIDDIINDRKALERLTGQIVKGMAYANGSYDDRVISVLRKCGIVYARTVKSTHDFSIDDDWLRLSATCHHNDQRLFELADIFLAGGKGERHRMEKPKLFYLWGHSYEFDNDDNWDRIEAFAKRIGGDEDVWYATNGDIIRYIEAYKALEYSVDGNIVYNPTAIDVCIKNANNEKRMATAGKRTRLD